MNAKEKAIIINKLKETKAECKRHEGTLWEREAYVVYYRFRALARDLGVEWG